MIRRRRLLRSAAAAFALPAARVRGQGEGAGEAARLVDAAFEYAFPLFEFARLRWRAVHAGHGGSNALVHQRRLSDAHSRAVTTPNNDTLYSSAWLDLSGGPVRLQVGRMPAARYWSVALMDAATNNVALLGQGRDGQGPLEVSIVASGHADARGRVLDVGGFDAWLLVRCLVGDPGELAIAHAMQDGIALVAPQVPVPALPVPVSSLEPANFLAVVNAQLARNPPPRQDAALLERLRPTGLAVAEGDGWERLDASMRETWRARIGAAHASLRRAADTPARQLAGWTVADPALGDFGTNYRLRAATALAGLGALPPQEALYLSRQTDDAGYALRGAERYRLRVPPGGVPARAFWSVSLYTVRADGRRFFADNALDRYAVGDRTPGLQRNADGSIDIQIQHEPPALVANWLPAPLDAFVLVLRAYLPQPALLAGTAALPSLTRAAPLPPGS
jgi:hypothetical protein